MIKKQKIPVVLLLLLCLVMLLPGCQNRKSKADSEQEAAAKKTAAQIRAAEANKKYKESPLLKARVEAGELPPVEERLPDNPMVVKPTGEIGQYGGSIGN